MPSTFAAGLVMGESPRWHDGALWVCDLVAGEVLRFDAVGQRATVHRVEGFPFSIDWLRDGRLVATTPSGVRVEGCPFSIDWLRDGRLVATTPSGVRVEADGALAPYGASGQGWNEIVVAP